MNVVDRIVNQRGAIPYHKEYNGLTGGASETIFFQQIIFNWHKYGRKEFYFFFKPCDHEKYKSDKKNSWKDELNFTDYKTRKILSGFGFKLGKTSKKQLKDIFLREAGLSDFRDSEDEKFLERLYDHIRKNVFLTYRTDSDKLTWYKINEKILNEIVKRYENGDEVKKSFSVLNLTVTFVIDFLRSKV